MKQEGDMFDDIGKERQRERERKREKEKERKRKRERRREIKGQVDRDGKR